MMTGWKTYFAVVALFIAGAYDIIILGDYQSGITKILSALALLGIGGKLSKLEKK